MVNNPRCTFVMVDGRRCRSSALRGEDFWLLHSPDHEEKAAETRRLGGPSGAAKKRPWPEPMNWMAYEVCTGHRYCSMVMARSESLSGRTTGAAPHLPQWQ